MNIASETSADLPFSIDLKNKNKKMSFGDLAHYLYLTANIACAKYNAHNLIDKRYEIEKKKKDIDKAFFFIPAHGLITSS